MRALVKVVEFGARRAWMWRDRRDRRSSESPRLPQLLIDVSTIVRHDAQTGIQRVVRSVLAELLGRDGNGFRARPVYATATTGYCYATLHGGGTLGRSAKPVRVSKGDVFLGLDLASQIITKYQDQVNHWRSQGATIHLLVYDLLPILKPEWFTAPANRNHQRWLDFLFQNADQAICISNSVVDDLRELYSRANPGREFTIGRLMMGGDIEASMPSLGISREVEEILGRMALRPTILMVGTIEPRKGYDSALAAFDYLWRHHGEEAPDLVIVGKRGWKTERIQAEIETHPEQGGRLHWLKNASDEALCALYDASSGVLLASHGEGFGLPLLEAASRRRPILARDLPVFRQQNAPGAIFFADDRPSRLGKKVMELMRMGERPVPLANVCTWQQSVDGLLVTLGLNMQDSQQSGRA